MGIMLFCSTLNLIIAGVRGEFAVIGNASELELLLATTIAIFAYLITGAIGYFIGYIIGRVEDGRA
jgi:hypothetical protein